MEAEVLRLLTDWLDGTSSTGVAVAGVSTTSHAVNALLPFLPRDAGDQAPHDVTVHDETRDAATARANGGAELTLPTVPELRVLLFQNYERMPDIISNGAESDRADQFEVVIYYRAPASTDPARAKLDASLTMRAVARSLNRLQQADLTGPARIRNAVQLVDVGSIRRYPTVVANDPTALAAIVAVCDVIDLDPLGRDG